ncbi:MAG: formyl transferase [Firmicutes bacterium HGW-Firmicutes-14]|nr:MAG: formyl transferase [Firmicutes bacterium HGW-Firmicutes-14]
MKIGYFGDGLWSHLALNKILEDSNFDVVFIVTRHENADPVLKEFAQKLQIPCLSHASVNAKGFIDEIKRFNPDLNVSMSFDQILKKEIINLAPLGFINCHAGALPFYRGRNVLNWALINGESSFGVTVHYIDEGIDTGDIIVQRFGNIDQDDDYASLLEKASNLCADALFEALKQIFNGVAEPISQAAIHPVGFYCGRRLNGDEWLDWNWSSQQIHNFVRGITVPGPCARTYLNDKEIAVLSTEIIPEAPAYIGTPGEIIGKEQTGIIVKTGDSIIRVKGIVNIAQDGNIFPGDIPVCMLGSRLGLNPWLKLREYENRLLELEKLVNQLRKQGDNN